MSKTTLIILSFFAFSTSYSQEWKLIHSNTENIFHIKQNSENTAWIRITKNPDYIDFDLNEFTWDITEKKMILFRYDCIKKQLGELAYTSYNYSDKIMKSYQNEEYKVKMEYAIPESMGEVYVNAFCELE